MRPGRRHLGTAVEAVATGAGLVVRACRSKPRRVLCEDGEKKGLTERPVLTRRSLNHAACGDKRTRKKREVTLDVRAARVRLVPPGDRTGGASLSMLAVSVAEVSTGCCSRRRENPKTRCASGGAG